MNNTSGRSIRLFLVDGLPRGLITAEIVNWTGRVLFMPRSRLAEAITRPEAKKTGVYLLVGEDPEQPSKTRVYIGESDDVASRLKQHGLDSSKEFWSEACLVTSKDENLTKAHARYLESRLIEVAKRADRAMVANNNEPGTKSLPEADIADMEFFLLQLQTILPVLGFDFLRPTPRKDPVPPYADPSVDDFSRESSLELVLSPQAHGVLAHGIEQEGEITVLRGSRGLTEAYASNNYSALRRQLLDDGRIRPLQDSAYVEFVEDITFKSPSAAAAVVLNRNANGRTEWRLQNGQTLKDFQDARIQAASSLQDSAEA